MPEIIYDHTVNLNYNSLIKFRLPNLTDLEMAALGLTLGVNNAGYLIWNTDQDTLHTWAGTSFVSSAAGTIDWNDVQNKPTDIVLESGSYADPSWITSLDWSKITNTPSFVTSLGALSDVNLTLPLGNYSYLAYDTGTSKWINVGPPTLQQVLDYGESASLRDIDISDGGVSKGTLRAKHIKIHNGTYDGLIDSTLLTANRSYELPDASGTLALAGTFSGYVPTSRTLTINGTSYDLSANRTWTLTTSDVAEGTNLYYTATRFNSAFAAKTTSDLAEGTNLYYTDARARGAISETVTGLDYNNTTGILSLTSGYVIPTTTEETNWNTAYGWGNHASAGYLTGNQSITLTGDVSGSGTTSITTTIGAGKVTNTMLVNSTISGISLGSNLSTLTFGTGLSGTSYNGSTGVTIATSGAYTANGFTMATSRLLGRTTASSGAAEEISVTTASGISLSGGALALSSIPNSSLANSTISGISLGSNLGTLTISSPLTGTSYNGSAGVSIGIQDAAADGTTKGAATFTAADFDATSGVISIDYTNGQAASASNKGFLTSADWSTFNGKAGSGANTDITSVLLNQTGLVVKGASSNALTIKPNETLSAARTLNLIVNNVDRTINLGGNITTAGAFTTSGAFGLTITLTNTTSVTFPTTGTLITTTNVSGSANFSARFTGTNTVGSGLIRDNGSNTSIGTAINASYTLLVSGATGFTGASTWSSGTSNFNNDVILSFGNNTNGFQMSANTGSGLFKLVAMNTGGYYTAIGYVRSSVFTPNFQIEEGTGTHVKCEFLNNAHIMVGSQTLRSTANAIEATLNISVLGTTGNVFAWDASTTAPSTVAYSAPTNTYGNNTNMLGTPTKWLLISTDGGEYKIPAY